MTSTVKAFNAKFYPPAPRPTLVSRPHLLRRLDLGLQGRLALISAPAGYGKTTLLAEWCMEAPLPVAWLSLDEQDDDPGAFCNDIRSALQRAGWEGDGSLSDLPLQAALLRLLPIEQADRPLALVLDDYHVLRNTSIHQALAALIERLPAHLHLFIATRKDPPIPLARLRSSGALVELRAGHLRFSPAESAVFLEQKMGLRLASEEVSALSQRTEGWAAGLQLAALSLQEQPDPHRLIQSISGSHRYILDYLVEEVLDSQPPEIQTFLLRTAILRRLCASLCQALIDDPLPSGGVALEYLERSNLFLTPLDPGREWFRYHALFADLLQRRLMERGGRELAAELHCRAAGWYREAGDPVEAIYHALKARDWPLAARLMEEASTDFFKSGILGTYLPMLRALPNEELNRHPQLLQDMGWALALTGDLEGAGRFLNLAYQSAAPVQPNFIGETLAGQAYVACFQNDLERTLELGSRALELLPPENEWMRSVSAMVLGFAHWFTGDPQATQQAMQTALHTARRSGGQRVQKLSLAYLGRTKALEMDFRTAEEMYLAAIGSDLQPELSPGNDIPGFDLGALYYEWNDLEAADRYLEMGFAANEASGNQLSRMTGLRSLARLRLAQGREEEAWEAARLAVRSAAELGLGPAYQNLNAACCMALCLGQGDVERAEVWARRISGGEGLDAFQPLPSLALAHLNIACRRPEIALRLLCELEPSTAFPAWRFARFRLRLMQALADPLQARVLLGDELRTALRQRLVRSFLDLGEPMRQTLLDLAPPAEDGLSVGLAGLLDAFAQRSTRIPETSKSPEEGSLPPLVEALSERELEVLRLIAAGENTGAIAAGMFVAESTVRTHVKNIFTKLDVHSRLQAVEQARRRRLI